MSTPELPPSCRWVRDVEEATAALAAGHIPLIRPRERQRADRWAAIMRWYDPAGLTSSGPGSERSAVVISVASAADLGRLAGAALDRPHRHLDTLTDTRHLPTGQSVLVVTPAVDTTLGALTPALNLWEEFGTRVGLLTGRDRAGMVFALAKILATRTSSTHLDGSTVVLDGRNELARAVDDDRTISLAESVASAWQAMVIDAAGGASHARLGSDLVLCGLSNAREHDTDGQPVPGGCSDRDCKIAPQSAATSVHPHDLQTTVLALFVPGAVALGHGERYPSEISLPLDALEGFPAAVLGLVRSDTHTTGLEPAVTGRLLRAGVPLGQAVGDLNAGIAMRGQPHAALLLGDPDHIPSAADGAGIPTLDIVEHPDVPVVVSNQRAVPALLAGGRALFAEPDPDLRLRDAHDDVVDMLSKLRNWPARLAEAELIEDALASGYTGAPESIHQSLHAMRSARIEAAHQVASTVRHMERLLGRRESGLPANPDKPLIELSEQWSWTLAELLATSSDDIAGTLGVALTAHHRSDLTRGTAVDPCAGCGAPCQRRKYVSALPICDRSEIHCPRCGTTSSQPRGGSAVMLRPTGEPHPGQRATVEGMVDGAWDSNGVLCIQLRPDFPTARPIAVHNRIAEAGPFSVTLAVPIDAVPDLYWIWSFYGSQFHIAFARTRVFVTPNR